MIDNTLEALELDKRLNDVQKKQPHSDKKPDISKYEDAVAELPNGSFVAMFDIGDQIIIERYATCISTCPWLDTRTYTVLDINDDNGDIHLWHDESRLRFMGNYITGPTGGDVYKRALVKPKSARRRKIATNES